MTQPSSLSSVVLGAAVLALPLTALSLSSCDKLGVPTSPNAVANAAANCPNIASVGAILQLDWAKEFGIEASVASSIQAGVRAAVEIDAFAAELDAKLVTACGGLAKDLGKPGSYANGQEACKAAMAAMGEVKAKIGAGAKITLAVQPPYCRASVDAMAECVAECDATVEPGSVTVECEKGKLSGTCEAECSGRCDLSAAAACQGTCEGSCSASFSGTCGGECNGKCDGKTMKGSCAGKCEGSCSALAEGSCGGQCSGSCHMSASAKCEGTCTGECSVEMKAPQCEGEIVPPKASAECNAGCETSVQAEVECVPAKVALMVEGGADAAAVAQLRTAIVNNLPAVLEIAIGMKKQALGVAADVKAVVGGIQGTIKAVGQGSASAGARLSACVASPFAAAIDAAGSIQANVSVSVEVQASVTASGSASGSASGGAG